MPRHCRVTKPQKFNQFMTSSWPLPDLFQMPRSREFHNSQRMNWSLAAHKHRDYKGNINPQPNLKYKLTWRKRIK